MKKRLTAFLAALMLLLQGAKAQTDSINAYLLTCEPGKAIYELYGHAAIWIEDVGNGTDVVFNYGLFDFDTPHFVWKFTLGQTDYILGATRMRSFLHEYKERGSEVFAQQLNMTQDETHKLYSLLIENSRPENREYRYNFLYNNCATMAIDKVEQSINGTVSYPKSDQPQTFREILTEHTRVRPWSEFAVNLIIGAEGDRPAGYRQEAFAPLHLMEIASKAVITDTAGISRPLVISSTELAHPDHDVDFGNPLFTPVQVMMIILMAIILVSLLGWYRNKPYWLTDAILFGIQGVGGIVIAVMFFFSEHPTLGSNWLVICLNPLPLIFLPFVIHRIRKGRVPIFLIADFAVCLSFLVLTSVIPQKIDTATLIAIAVFALRAFSTSLFMIFRKVTGAVPSSFKSRLSMFILLLAASATSMKAADEKRPKLVVGIVIDQLDNQTLQMMMPLMGNDGLSKIWIDSYNRDNVTFDFDNSDRASAVASIYTGASPFQHGIVAGRWMNRKTLMASSPLDDGNSSGINTIEHTSPQKLLATNLADEMKLESEGRSKICAIAAYRDAAVLAAGHEADVCIWMNHDDGKWASSDYYGSLPEWVNKLNDSILPRYTWQPSRLASDYIRITGQDQGHTFSHNIRQDSGEDMLTSPFSNDWVNAAAIAALDGMNLGRDDTPDLLSLTYYAGNFRHGNNSISSIELQDIYLRLDYNIAGLIKEINDRIGIDNVLFFITSTGYADYSAPDLASTRIPTGTVNMERAVALLNLYLSAKYGSEQYIETYFHNQIYLNHRLIEDKGVAMHEILDNSVDLLVQMSGVRNVILLRDLMSTIPDQDAARRRNAYNNSYTGDIIIEAIPGWGITDVNEDITEYRRPTPQPFPMILYGNGIRGEINHEPISVSVLIPTVCNILRCNAPNASYSNPLIGLK
jgi:hypothetical protein